ALTLVIAALTYLIPPKDIEVAESERYEDVPRGTKFKELSDVSPIRLSCWLLQLFKELDKATSIGMAELMRAGGMVNYESRI
ncbi:MAG: hypothetical protein JSV68_00725, partial [Anaerolineaceae bacterium]